MITKTFGKKCKCSHFESQHNVQKSITMISKVPNDLGIFLPIPPTLAESIRINCKICNCKKFNS